MTAKIIPFTKEVLKCSFCKKEETASNHILMVARYEDGTSTGKYACKDCVKLFTELIKDE